MDNTVIAVYDSYAQAESAMNELLTAGFSRDDVQLSPGSDRASMEGSTASSTDQHAHGSGIGNFFRSLFGMEDDATHSDVYSEAVRRGSCVLTVDADNEEQRDRAIDVMNRHDPVDIDERSTHWRSQGWSGYDPTAPRLSESEIQQDRSMYAQSSDLTRNQAAATSSDATLRGTKEGTRIPVVEEELRVGKREVQRGGVRVIQRVREKPVNESVELREEHVHVERHPVDKPATQADLAGLKEGQVEMREMAEEPVVSKDARIVEEVEVGKEVTQRTADIKDTVRRTDVEVEQLGARDATTRTTMDDSDFRKHWQTSYGQSGGSYDDYASAYRYGADLSNNDRYKAYGWNDVEPDIRTDWERNHPESAWEKVKDAVRYGKERATGRR